MFLRILVPLAVLASCQAGAATLKGVVRLDGMNGPAIPRIGVSAVDGANRIETDSDGLFRLEFPSKRPGETVFLIVAKENYEVVNDVQLELSLPVDAGAKPLIVIVCKKGNREEMARRFYHLKSLEAIDETYRKKLEEMKSATAAELGKLRQERDQAREVAAKGAEELAKNQSGQTSELYREAMRAFLDGNIEQALLILDDDKLKRMLNSAEERETAAKQERAKLTQAWTTKAELLTLQFRFAEAEQAYKAAIAASPDSFAAHFAFGSFSQELNHYAAALQAYQRCLELAKAAGNAPWIARTLNNLGVLHRDENRMEKAGQAFEAALKIRRELARKNPDTYLPDVALTLNNLGNLHREQNRMEEAGQAYEEALEIYRELARKNPDIYRPAVATTLNNLGSLHRVQNRMEEAGQAYEEALKIRRELARKNPDTYLPDVALTLNNLGNLHREQNRMEEAGQAFEEALEIYRELARKNPDTYRPAVAITLNNLGVLHSDQNRMEEARQAYEEALQIRRELARKNPDTYLPAVALTQNNLGILHRDQNRMEEARQSFGEALKSYRELAQKNPNTYLPYVATALNNLGVLHRDQKRMEEAGQAYEEALKIRRELAGKNPGTYLPAVANTLTDLGILHRDRNRMEEARQAYQEALGIYRRFAARNPERFQADVVRVERLLKELPQ